MAIEPETYVRFINESVQVFGEFLALFQVYRREAPQAEEEEMADLIGRVEKEMLRLDAAAFSGEGSIYPISGDGFMPTNKGEYLALRTLKCFDALTAERILANSRNVTAANRARAMEILDWGNSPLGK